MLHTQVSVSSKNLSTLQSQIESNQISQFQSSSYVILMCDETTDPRVEADGHMWSDLRKPGIFVKRAYDVMCVFSISSPTVNIHYVAHWLALAASQALNDIPYVKESYII